MALVVCSSCKQSQSRAPNVPAVPAGSQHCYKDTTCTFTTIATDPDGDSVAVRFDWGDSTVSYLSGWFASGDTIAMTHSWSDTGTFEVRALAQDQTQCASGLSGGLAIRVAELWPPDTLLKWRLRLASGTDIGLKSSPAIGSGRHGLRWVL